jgi:hypothetical protein
MKKLVTYYKIEFINIVTCMGVTIYGVWFGDWIH